MQQSRKPISESESENPEAKPTMMEALSILKHLQGRIQTTQKKLQVMHLRNEKQIKKQNEERRKLNTRSMVERDIEEYKKIKKEVQTNNEAEVEVHKMRNTMIKKELQQKINFARVTCRQNKSLMYSRGKKQESENEKIIKKNKNKLIKEKRKKFWAVIEGEIKGRKNVEKFMETRIKAQRSVKQSETNKLLQNIDQRRRMLTKLQRYGSVQELKEQRTQSMENAERDRNFRVKIISRGKTTFVRQ